MNIIKKFKNLIGNVNEPEYKEPAVHVRLFRFLPNRLFKGHQGSVWITNESIEFTNVYFNTICNQTFNFNGDLLVRISKSRKSPKWFEELILELAKKSNMISTDVTLIIQDGEYEVLINNENCRIRLHRVCKPEDVFTHSMVINESKKLGKILTQVLKNIKKLSPYDLSVMVKEINIDITEYYLKLNKNLFYED